MPRKRPVRKPLSLSIISPAHRVKFWSLVEMGPECWEWTGTKFKSGYGRMYCGSFSYVANRFSWIIHSGDIPPGMFVCHKCDNRSCVRPDHFFLGTQQENNKDMLDKGRARGGRNSGLKNGSVKLSPVEVERIKELAKAGTAYRDIAKMIKISSSQAFRIAKGESWAGVDHVGQ